MGVFTALFQHADTCDKRSIGLTIVRTLYNGNVLTVATLEPPPQSRDFKMQVHI